MLSVPAVNPPSHNNLQTPLSATPWEQRKKRLCFQCTFSASLNVPNEEVGRGGSTQAPKDALKRKKRSRFIPEDNRGSGERGPQTVKPQGQFLCKQLFENGLPRSRHGGHRGPISFWRPSSSPGLCTGERSTASFHPQPPARVPT